MEIAAFSQSSNSSSSPYPYQAQQIPATIHLNLEVKMERPPLPQSVTRLGSWYHEGQQIFVLQGFQGHSRNY